VTERATKRAYRRRLWAGPLAAVLLAACLAGLALIVLSALGASGQTTAAQASSSPAPPVRAAAQRVCAWSRGDAASLERAAAAHALDEVNFDWYHSLRDGSLKPQWENLKLVARAHALRISVFATITNRLSHTSPFDGRIASAILQTASSRRSHIAKLVDLCVSKGFDGIDMDWESMKAADRGRFTSFIQQLAAALHARHKLLSIAVYPKVSEPGSYGAQQAQDYAKLGAAVDELKVMTYAFSGGWSKPGPQMPLYWAKQVLAFARGKVAPRKVYMGMPFFGFDWKGSTAKYVLWKNVRAAQSKYGGTVRRDAASGEAVLRYTDAAGAGHVAYFQDRGAVKTKTAWMRTKQPQIAGMAIWVMGGEDPAFWPDIASQLGRP
jgi:spore germination protein